MPTVFKSKQKKLKYKQGVFMKTLLAKLQNLACAAMDSIKQWAVADWNQTVADYHSGVDWLCCKLKAALRTVD